MKSAWFLLVVLLNCGSVVAAEGAKEASELIEDEPAKIYRSPEERREAGLGRKLTEWLAVSGLAEAEFGHKENDYRRNISRSGQSENSQSVQLGLDVTVTRSVSAEFVFDYEIDQKNFVFDEGVLNVEWDPVGLELGRLFIPFGEYYSHFVTGPVLEFGETRGTGLVADFAINDQFEVSAFAIDGQAKRTGRSGEELDWGFATEINSADESIKFGASYFSDLSDTDELLLRDFNDKYSRRVGAWNAHLLFGRDSYEITAEVVAALGSFRELAKDEDKPWAANLEVAWFPRHQFQFAVRAEISDEFADEPNRQVGLSATWVVGKHMTLAADYLYGEFKNGFVFDDGDNELNARHQFAAQIAIEF